MIDEYYLLPLAIIIGFVFVFLMSRGKKEPATPEFTPAEKERGERLRRWTHRRRASLYTTPGVDLYNPPMDASEVVNRRECPVCGEIPWKKCYYCGKWFCEEHRLPEAHNCPNV